MKLVNKNDTVKALENKDIGAWVGVLGVPTVMSFSGGNWCWNQKREEEKERWIPISFSSEKGLFLSKEKLPERKVESWVHNSLNHHKLN